MIECDYAQWPAPDKVIALTTRRAGGVSVAPYDSLNLGAGCGDEPHAVAENRSRLRSVLGLPQEPFWLNQVHGCDVINVGDGAGIPEADRVADASISDGPGAVCAVLTADCLPVLLCDCDASIVAAAHCGWRGLHCGVLDSVVTAMNRPAESLLAWLGPAIGACDYEVGDDVRNAFVSQNEAYDDAFRPNKNRRWLADLYTIASLQLNALGLSVVHGGNESTYSDPGKFFSYRRDGLCGRMASLIWIET